MAWLVGLAVQVDLPGAPPLPHRLHPPRGHLQAAHVPCAERVSQPWLFDYMVSHYELHVDIMYMHSGFDLFKVFVLYLAELSFRD